MGWDEMRVDEMRWDESYSLREEYDWSNLASGTVRSSGDLFNVESLACVILDTTENTYKSSKQDEMVIISKQEDKLFSG